MSRRFRGSLLLFLACSGCQSPGAWWRARGLDLWDCMPTAVMRDKELGFNISARVTLFAQTGLGAYGANPADGNSYGMALGRWGPRWNEGVTHAVIGSIEYQELVGANWPGGPDGRFLYHDRGKLVRYNGNFLVVIPLAGLTDPAVYQVARFPDWYSVPDSEVALFAGWWGVRVGLAPAQLVDFLCGLVNLDPMGDDALTKRKEPEAEVTPRGDDLVPLLPPPVT